MIGAGSLLNVGALFALIGALYGLAIGLENGARDLSLFGALFVLALAFILASLVVGLVP